MDTVNKKKVKPPQASLAQSALEQNYQILFAHASDAILISDPESGNVIEANHQAEVFTGLSLSDLKKLSVADLVSPEEKEDPLEFFKAAMKERRVKVGNFRVLHKDGSSRAAEFSACLIELGDCRVIQSIIRDVTEREAAELERTRLLEKIQASYEELRRTEAQLVHSEKMASLGHLVAGVAHELNNPIGFLNSHLEHISGFIGVLKEMLQFYDNLLENDPEKHYLVQIKKEEVELPFILEKMEKLVDSCRCGALRTKEIVENLRTFSRMDEAAIKEADIHENLDTTLSLLRNQFRDRIAVHRDYGEIPILECNIGQLNQVFMNLILNACQAIPDRGDIWIKTRVEDEALTVSIRDSGVGIPQDQFSRIFDPFFTTKETGKGTGLGLSIAFGVVKEHGGSIDVESQVGEGSTFTVKLPIKRQLVWETDF
jgi:PAS domain S-box-containing protein